MENKLIKISESLSKPNYIFLNEKRIGAMCFLEAISNMEVTWRNNEKIVSIIKKGKYSAIKSLKGSMLKDGDFLIHPEHVDYFLCLKFNKINLENN